MSITRAGRIGDILGESTGDANSFDTNFVTFSKTANTIVRRRCPIFNEEGKVVSLHCLWDDETGIRKGQRLDVLLKAVAQVQVEE